MGLMLSVLVFCVGVAEALDCWHHFLLHLVQPQYNPLPYQLDRRADVLCERNLHTPPGSRKASHVDIHWPKDLSPGDDLHVIKKRRHNDSERSSDHDSDTSGHPSVGRIEHRGQASDAFLLSCTDSSDHTKPIVIVHPSEFSDFSEYQHRDSPRLAAENNPNLLELSVIIESDSSSEVDEPSQIENLNYKKSMAPQLSETSSKYDEEADIVAEELSRLTEVTYEGTTQGVDRCMSRPVCPSSLLLDEPRENETPPEDLDSANLTEVTNDSGLPVFTDNIVSRNVHKVTCRYAPNGSTPKDEQFPNDDTSKSKENPDVSDLEVSNFSTRNVSGVFVSDGQTVVNQQSIESILNEGLEPIPEFPEIRLQESSPTPKTDSTESSLNTSDASWMAKSRTSDRPLIIRFTPTPDDAAKEFMSVTKTDLHQAFGDKEIPVSKECFFETDSTEVYYDALEHSVKLPEEGSVGIKETGELYPEKSAVKPPDTSTTSQFNDFDVGDGCVDCQKPCDTESANLVQSITNSSSSSLNGIPQLPEDVKDTVSSTHLPTDNGYGKAHLVSPGGTVEKSDSLNDDLLQPLRSEGSSYTVNSLMTSSSNIAKSTSSENEISCHQEKLESNISEEPPPENESSPKNEAGAGAPKMLIDTTPFPVPTSLDRNLQSASCSEKKTTSEQTQKDKAVKELKVELSSKDSLGKPPESENAEKIYQAKKSDVEEHEANRAGASFKTRPLTTEVKNTVEAGPSTSTSRGDPQASTSKEDHPENKAFWLIFSGEYTKAMNKDWHSGHFCCWQCDESLTGQRYVLRDEHPYCIKCYESVFANGCEECSKTIGIDSKDLSYKDKHWHEACFLCNKCRVSLVDKQFGSKLDKIFCGNCYDAQFASRCDGCGQIFKAGTKKMEYKTRQWHEPCFACCVCKSAIGTKSFIPREQEIYCATCYEEKFATRCVKCNKIITSGGVTYKNEPWHRECFTCTNCNTSLAGQRFTSRDEKPYCADCFGELFAKRCTACCKPITGIGGTRFISFEDRHWHNDCFICASCKTSLVGRGFITDGDDIICPECAKQKLM